MIDKKFFLIFTFIVIMSLGVVSAYYYGDYSDTQYFKKTTEGNYNGYQFTRTIDYHKSSDTIYLSNGGIQTRLLYTKIVTEEPTYRYRYSSPRYEMNSWRTKPYNKYYYSNDYGKDYYYQPIRNSQGYYSWHY
jgi:hypothetical protein